MRPGCGGNFQREQAWGRQPGHSSAARGSHREPAEGHLDGLACLISVFVILVHENGQTLIAVLTWGRRGWGGGGSCSLLRGSNRYGKQPTAGRPVAFSESVPSAEL